MSEETLCACGCGQPVNEGRTYIKGHHLRTRSASETVVTLGGVAAATTSSLQEASPPSADRIRALKVLQMHGFIDEKGNNRLWLKDTVVCDPEEIDIIVARGVPFEIISK